MLPDSPVSVYVSLLSEPPRPQTEHALLFVAAAQPCCPSAPGPTEPSHGSLPGRRSRGRTESGSRLPHRRMSHPQHCAVNETGRGGDTCREEEEEKHQRVSVNERGRRDGGMMMMMSEGEMSGCDEETAAGGETFNQSDPNRGRKEGNN